MRVAIIITRPVILGPSIVMGSLLNSMPEKDAITDLYCLELPRKDEPVMHQPFKIFNRHTFPFEYYDILHTSGIKPDLLAFLNRKRIRYHISTLHSLVSEEFILTRNRLFSFVFGNLWLSVLKRADKIVCVSETVKDSYISCFSQSQLEVIYNGISENDSTAMPGYDFRENIDRYRKNGLKIIGTASILTKLKNTRLILELVAARDEYACIILGSGKEEKHLGKLASELGISDRCYFAGFRKDAPAHFRFFDVFVSASLSEGFGLTIAEAVREKVPVICSGIPVFRELYAPGEVTFFDPLDINSLSAALDATSEQGKEKSEAAYIAFKTKYTAKLMGMKYYELYKSVNNQTQN